MAGSNEIHRSGAEIQSQYDSRPQLAWIEVILYDECATRVREEKGFLRGRPGARGFVVARLRVIGWENA